MSAIQSTTLSQIITAVGGLGTAAFGLVDASKPILGINYIGFSGIRAAMQKLLPPAGTSGAGILAANAVKNLEANWINGTDLASQKAIAKSLVKLNMNQGDAQALADATGVDATKLASVAASIASNTPLTADQANVYARFDLILTALLDEVYQRADQVYRNWTRLLAAVFAIILAILGGIILDGKDAWLSSRRDILASLVVGLLATPLAPLAKDLSSALATAVNTMQLVKKGTS